MNAVISLAEFICNRWRGRAIAVFMALELGHVSEHVIQVFQIYVLGWPLADARGILGQFFPWLVTSETLHYFYTMLTVVGIVLLIPAFIGSARNVWFAALIAAAWHNFEHTLLLFQRSTGQAFFGADRPTSLAQLWFPRVELHFFYNMVVLMPLLTALAMDYRARRARGREEAPVAIELPRAA